MPASGEGYYYYEYRSGNINNTGSDIQDRSGRYGPVNGPGMDKKYDGNTLWSTFYCLEDVIHGVLRNNISIDIVMPTSQMQIFLPSKKGKANINISYQTRSIATNILLPSSALMSLSLFPLVFVLAEVSGRRNLAWPGLS